MNVSAIEHFCGVLRKVPASNWDFSIIACEADDDAPLLTCSELTAALATLEPSCGAVGCALGHAQAAFPSVTSAQAQPLAEVLGMSTEHVEDLCGTGVDLAAVYFTTDWNAITQFDVADAFERYTREGCWWRS